MKAAPAERGSATRSTLEYGNALRLGEPHVAGVHLEKLTLLLDAVWGRNAFYTEKWRAAGLKPGAISSLDELEKFPFTARDELLADQTAFPPLGRNLTWPLGEYKRIVRSSGTTRSRILWADSARSWQWLLRCSQSLYGLAGIAENDRLFFMAAPGVSSGGSILFEGACRLGCGCINDHSADSHDQLGWIKDFQPNVLVGKPGRLRDLAVAARDSKINPAHLHISKLILTGEPSRETVRPQLEQLWRTECFDRYGMTEAGSVACECAAHAGGMHLLDDEFIVETISPETAHPVPDGEPGELVLTNLGRIARPIVRYRTGDRVRLIRNHRCACGRTGTFLQGDIVRL